MSGESQKPGLQRIFVCNLLLLLALGTGVSAWILRYTDVFEEFAGLLALSGLFSWLAFVSKLLPESRVVALQEWADGALFTEWRTTRILGGVIVAVLLLCCFVGSVQVQSFDPGDRAMEVGRRSRKASGEITRLLSGGKLREWFFTSWPFPTTIRVKAIGLPELWTTVAPWGRNELYLPASFIRPVILLTPNPKPIDFKDAGGSVQVFDERNNRWDEIPFDGRAIWIGCDREVQVPAHAADALREEIKGMAEEADRTKVTQSWFNPTASERPKPLPAGTLDFVFVRGTDKLPLTSVRVLHPATFRDFPQRVRLDAP
jgi:hypothetical protein